MWRLRLQRWIAQRRAGPLAARLRDYWRAPLPARSTPFAALELLVCDGEMSGLDPDTAELLSLGWVRISCGELRLDSAEHHLVRARGSVGASATIHQLRDCDLAGARPVGAVLEDFLAAAAGRVVVFHHAPLDTAFLDRAATAVFGAPLLLPVIDTLTLERRLLARREEGIGPGDLRLDACRARYGLPPHAAHNALGDALATGELLLAHVARRDPDLTLAALL